MHDWTDAPATAAPANWRERVILAGVFLLPLACWPGLERPFSTPKLSLLAALAAMALTDLALQSRAAGSDSGPGLPARAFPWPIALWVGAVGLSAVVAPFVSLRALLMTLLPLPLFLAAASSRLDAGRLLRAVACASALQSAIVLLQWLGYDPLRALGWRADISGSERMRVYGTFGNPNFVAAWLSATLPLVVPVRRPVSPWLAAALVLQASAVLLTGSRVLLLALPAAFAVHALAGRRLRPGRCWWIAGLAAAVLAVWLSPARALGVTVEGRYYLVRMTAAHLRDVPLTGHGPGSFASRFAGWQVEYFREHEEGTAARRFAGLADHAHNDYLEFWVEYGPVGLAAFMFLGGWLFARAWSSASTEGLAALAGAAGILAIGLADFPLHRPAECALAWVLLGAAAATGCLKRPVAHLDVQKGEASCP